MLFPIAAALGTFPPVEHEVGHFFCLLVSVTVGSRGPKGPV